MARRYHRSLLASCAIAVAVIRMVLPRARVSIVLTVQVAMSTREGPVIVRLGAVELAATLIEAAIYARCLGLRARVALALSAAANAASLLALSWL